MEVDEAQARMREIQRIMETATLFTLLPGTAAVVGGLLVFLGCGGSYWFLNSLDFAEIVRLSMSGRVTLCLMWVAIAVASVVVNAVLHGPIGCPATDRAQSATGPGGHVRVDSLRRGGRGADAPVPLGMAAAGDPLHRPGLDAALRDGRLYGRPVLDPRAPRAGPGVSAGGHRGLVLLFPTTA